MGISRRNFVQISSALVAATVLSQAVLAAENTIKLGSVLDTSGGFAAYGKPMDMAMRLAVCLACRMQ